MEVTWSPGLSRFMLHVQGKAAMAAVGMLVKIPLPKCSLCSVIAGLCVSASCPGGTRTWWLRVRCDAEKRLGPLTGVYGETRERFW